MSFCPYKTKSLCANNECSREQWASPLFLNRLGMVTSDSFFSPFQYLLTSYDVLRECEIRSSPWQQWCVLSPNIYQNQTIELPRDVKLSCHHEDRPKGGMPSIISRPFLRTLDYWYGIVFNRVWIPSTRVYRINELLLSKWSTNCAHTVLQS